VEPFLAALDGLPIIVDAHSGDCILSDVHQFAIAYGLTSYDAAYLESAQRLNLPLATLDAELVAACKAASVISTAVNVDSSNICGGWYARRVGRRRRAKRDS
jgi:predicted nucleic acid-binding protein